MSGFLRWTTAGFVVASLLLSSAASPVSAQVNRRDVPIATQPQQRFDAGQDIQPIYEGWTRNDDGSFSLHFGYLNRNHREQPNVPIGPNNYFSPGDQDREQPTHFYPRTHRYQFSVRVPADMGTSFEDGLVWTVTHNGSAQQAIGWLKPEWEIEVNTITSNLRTGFGRSKAELYANASPTVTVGAAQPTVTVGEPLTLTAVLTDDELPTRKPPRGERRNRIPSLVAPDDAPKAPDNVQWYKKPAPPRNGLSLLWIVYRGPDDATFDPAGFQRSVVEEKAEESSTSTSVVATTADTADPTEVATSLAGDGWTSATFEATVTFDEPGTYTLKAVACDAMMMTHAEVVVTVTDVSGGP